MKNLSNLLFWIIVPLTLVYIPYQKGYIFNNFENISTIQAHDKLLTDTNITIIDVRTKEEIKSDGKIKNSILIPVQVLEESLELLEKFKDKKIYIYCRTGNRSVTASRMLTNAGFKAYNIQGGIKNWKKKGLPIEY